MLTTQSISGSYRYVRYLAPAGGYGNIAELEAYGNQTLTVITVRTEHLGTLYS